MVTEPVNNTEPGNEMKMVLVGDVCILYAEQISMKLIYCSFLPVVCLLSSCEKSLFYTKQF